MTQASDDAQAIRIRIAINTYLQGRILDRDNEAEHAAILFWSLLEITDMAERNDLVEQGRRLASQREDIIAAGVDPSELLVPRLPDD